MGTDYYGLSPPITSVKIEDQNPGHTRLGIWINHAKCGTLTLRTNELRSLLLLLRGNESVLSTYWGGSDRGAVVTVNKIGLSDDMIVISECGELLTVADVKARDGARREDGFPTELFGYED